MPTMLMSFPAIGAGVGVLSEWQDGIFSFLSAAYALVSSVALVQLIRIEDRIPEYGWTTQKVFQLMIFIVNGVRALVFGFHMQVFLLQPKVLTLVLLYLPDVLFFSTYSVLVLFWADIYNQAKGLPADKLRNLYFSINGGVYFVQACLWGYLWIDYNSTAAFIGRLFIAAVSFVAALGFLHYGGRLFIMLRRFPGESEGRREKLYQIGSLTAIGFTCFLIRCFVIIHSAASLDALDHPVSILIYYTLVEILPSALVLYILRKLPPKRVPSAHHHRNQSFMKRTIHQFVVIFIILGELARKTILIVILYWLVRNFIVPVFCGSLL